MAVYDEYVLAVPGATSGMLVHPFITVHGPVYTCIPQYLHYVI
jgi:hypothetical protein